MWPSPELAMSKFPPSEPKPAGARATPDGASGAPPDTEGKTPAGREGSRPLPMRGMTTWRWQSSLLSPQDKPVGNGVVSVWMAATARDPDGRQPRSAVTGLTRGARRHSRRDEPGVKRRTKV